MYPWSVHCEWGMNGTDAELLKDLLTILTIRHCLGPWPHIAQVICTTRLSLRGLHSASEAGVPVTKVWIRTYVAHWTKKLGLLTQWRIYIVKFSSFSCRFRQIWPNNRLTPPPFGLAPLWEILDPPLVVIHLQVLPKSIWFNVVTQ